MIPLVDPSRSRRTPYGGASWLKSGVRYAVAVLALVATGVAGYLTWTTLGQKPVVGCGDSGVVGCDDVLATTWSKFLGMPTSAPGTLTYAAIFVLSLASGTRNETASRWIGTLLVMFALLAAGAALWFTGLQLLVVQKICPFCLAVHACGLTIAALLLWSAVSSRSGQLSASQSAVALAGAMPGTTGRSGATRTTSYSNPFAGPSMSLASVGAVLGLVALIGGQIMFPPKTYDVSTVTLDESINLTSAKGDVDEASADVQPHVVHRVPTDDANEAVALDSESSPEPLSNADTNATNESGLANDMTDEEPVVEAPPAAPHAKREVSFLDGKLTVDLYSEAVLGSPDAPYVIIEMIDYTCPHCRLMHDKMKQAMRRYGDQLAIVVMPVPLELECNRRLPKTDPMHRGACRLARLAISVAQLNPSVFLDFQNFLMRDEDDPPQYGTALLRGFKTVNRDKLRDLINSEEIEKRIQQYINLYANLSARQKSSDKPFGLPVQIVGDKVLTGKFDTSDEMFDAWEEAIEIRPN